MAIRHHHPFKFIWTLLAIVFNAVRVPFWAFYFLPSFLRPNPKWTYMQAVSVRVLRAYVQYMWQVEMKTPLSLKPGKEGIYYLQAAKPVRESNKPNL